MSEVVSGSPGDDWFLRRVFKTLVMKFSGSIATERVISKTALYCHMSWHHRFSRNDSREILRAVARTYPGVRFSNRGLFIPKEYLESLV